MFGDHHHRRVGVAGNGPRHDRNIGDAQTLHAADTQLVIDNRHRVCGRSHPCCAGRVEHRLGGAPHENAQGVIIVQFPRSGQDKAGSHLPQPGGFEDPHREFRAAQEHFEVFRIREAAGIEQRRIPEVRRTQPDRAARTGAQDARIDRKPVGVRGRTVDPAHQGGQNMELQIRDAGIRDIDEAAAIDQIGGERSGAKRQVLGRVPQRPGSPVFPVERNPAFREAPDADFQVIPVVRTDAGKVADDVDSVRPRMPRLADITPDSCSSLGVSIASAQRAVSRRAPYLAPFSTSTPVARAPSNRIRLTRVGGLIVRFGRFSALRRIANFHEALKAQATMSERSQVNIDRAMNAARAHGERRTKSRLLRDYRKSLELAAQQIRLLSIMARRDADFVIHFTKVLRTAIAALRQIHRAGCTVQ